MSQTPSSKSITGNFELETKIRLIIQDVLSATIRKLSHFGDKVEKFEEYFMTFRERFEGAERDRGRQEEDMGKLAEGQMAIRKELNLNDIRFSEEKQRVSLVAREQNSSILELERQVKTLLRQNQSINGELSKTKSKFLEYSNTISAMKEEVAWKITKYLEETAESHTQMKVYSQNIKNQYFNIGLMIQKQKSRYEQIILQHEDDSQFRQQTQESIKDMQALSSERQAEIIKLNTKLDDVEFSLLSKIKQADTKLQNKMTEYQKSSSKLQGIVKKVQNFGELLQKVRVEITEVGEQTERRIEGSIRKAAEYTDEGLMKTAKDILRTEKGLDKKINVVEGKIDKSQDFFLQKIEFVKMQLQSEMATKTNKMIEQKTKKEATLSAGALEQVNGKFNKFQLEQGKQLSRVEQSLREGMAETKRNIDEVRTTLEEKIVSMPRKAGPAPSTSSPSNVGNAVLSASVTADLAKMKESLDSIGVRVGLLQEEGKETSEGLQTLKKKVEDKLIEYEEKMTSKVEKVMFLVTKMRGDSIIRNEFNDKQIKELKKVQIELRARETSICRLLPGLSECCNLILALIFDAEYQHSKIIQDNLPLLSKDVERFNTCNQGVIYQFKEKKKPGNIFYRHQEIKKTDIVRATFNGFLQMWEEVAQTEQTNKNPMMPKFFYKSQVEKCLRNPSSQTPSQATSNPSLNQMRSSGPVSQSRGSGDLSGGSSKEINTSFHIRRKKTVAKQRDDVFVMNENSIRQ